MKFTSPTRRRRLARVLLPALVIVGLASAVAACGGSSSTGTSGKSATSGSSSSPAGTPASGTSNASLVVNVSVPPASLDPTYTYTNQDAGLSGSFYSTLTQVGQEPGPIPDTTQQNLATTAVKPYLAESWKITDGGKTYTFKLRPGLKFPSGHPLDAAAVKYSLDRTIKVQGGGYSVLEETQLKPPLVTSVSAPNPTTVVIKYQRPAPNQLQVLSTPTAGAIYDPSVVNAHGGVQAAKPNKWLASHTAGYGPYLLDSYQPGHRMVLKANPDFFQPPLARNVIINFTTDDATLLLQARSGAADVTLGLSPQATHSLTSDSCCKVGAFKSRMAETLQLPQIDKYSFFKNEQFRQALSDAFPYKDILDKVAFGYGKLYSGEWMPVFPWYNAKVGAPHATDMNKAKQLMQQSGVKTPVSFPIYVAEGDTIGKQIATAAAGAWQPLGVNAKVQVVSASQLVDVVYTSHASANVFIDGPQVVAPDYYWAYDLQCPKNNPYNDTLVCLPEADALMKKIPAATGQNRQNMLDQVNTMYANASPRIWVYNAANTVVLSKNVTKFYASDLPEVRFWSK
jgi:peptide/nickel transport system substrate-binding protein